MFDGRLTLDQFVKLVLAAANVTVYLVYIVLNNYASCACKEMH